MTMDMEDEILDYNDDNSFGSDFSEEKFLQDNLEELFAESENIEIHPEVPDEVNRNKLPVQMDSDKANPRNKSDVNIFSGIVPAADKSGVRLNNNHQAACHEASLEVIPCHTNIPGNHHGPPFQTNTPPYQMKPTPMDTTQYLESDLQLSADECLNPNLRSSSPDMQSRLSLSPPRLNDFPQSSIFGSGLHPVREKTIHQRTISQNIPHPHSTHSNRVPSPQNNIENKTLSLRRIEHWHTANNMQQFPNRRDNWKMEMTNARAVKRTLSCVADVHVDEEYRRGMEKQKRDREEVLRRKQENYGKSNNDQRGVETLQPLQTGNTFGFVTKEQRMRQNRTAALTYDEPCDGYLSMPEENPFAKYKVKMKGSLSPNKFVDGYQHAEKTVRPPTTMLHVKINDSSSGRTVKDTTHSSMVERRRPEISLNSCEQVSVGRKDPSSAIKLNLQAPVNDTTTDRTIRLVNLPAIRNFKLVSDMIDMLGIPVVKSLKIDENTANIVFVEKTEAALFKSRYNGHVFKDSTEALQCWLL